MLRALEQLYALGALDAAGQLTAPLGRQLARLPTDPTLGRVLLAATAVGMAPDAIAVVAMASSDPVFLSSRHAPSVPSEASCLPSFEC